MKIVLISDTHLRHEFSVPEGDMLIHAGDLTMGGTMVEIARAGNWIIDLPFKHKVIVPGNHDTIFERDPALAKSFFGDAHVLIDSGVTVDGLKIWGSPYTSHLPFWAFQREREEEWDIIPEGLDILLTHAPPRNVLDVAKGGYRCGSKGIAKNVFSKMPRIHVFGHIHESRGKIKIGETQFFNAAICDVGYKASGSAFVVDL